MEAKPRWCCAAARREVRIECLVIIVAVTYELVRVERLGNKENEAFGHVNVLSTGFEFLQFYASLVGANLRA